MAVDLIPTIFYSGMIGVVILAAIQAYNKPKHEQNRYLLPLLFLLLVHIAGELYIYSGLYQYAPAIAGFQMPIRMLLGPAFYFYACAAMSPTNKISNRHYLIAFSGLLIVVIAMLPFVFVISPQDKLALANPLTRDPQLWKIAISTCLFSAVAFIVYTYGYLIAALRLHAHHRLQLMERFSEIGKRSMDWLRIVLIIWGVVWFIYTVNYVSTFLGVKWFVIKSSLPLAELIILLAFTHLSLNQMVLSPNEKAQEQNPPVRNAILSEAKMKEVAEKLISAMDDKALFKLDDLSLNTLSMEVSVSENHISETLSQYLHTNFFQFVNGYRIEEAKNLLSSTDMSVSTIVYEVGFKSKSTFNSAFKKIVGATPTAFKKSI